MRLIVFVEAGLREQSGLGMKGMRLGEFGLLNNGLGIKSEPELVL